MANPIYFVLFFVAYLGAAWLEFALGHAPESVLALRPYRALYLAVLLLSRKRHWPWWILAAMTAEIAGDLALFQFPLSTALSNCLGATVEALTGASFIRRWYGTPFRLNRLREVLALTAFGAVVGPALGMVLNTSLLAVTGRENLAAASWLSWIGHAAGILTVTPLVLTIVQLRRPDRTIYIARWAEAVALFATFAGVSHLVFTDRFPFVHLLILPFLWAALRFEMFGTTLMAFMLSAETMFYTAAGARRFASLDLADNGGDWAIPSFLGIASITALVIAALTREHRLTRLALRRADAELEARIPERTAELSESGGASRLGSEGFTATLVAEPVVIFSQDCDLRYTWILNPSISIDPKAVIGRTDRDLIARAEEADRLIAIKRRVLETGETAREEVALTNDGAVSWLDLNVQPQRVGVEIVGILGTVVNITERKHREERARRNEIRLRLASEAAHVIPFEWDIRRNQIRRFVSTDPALPETLENAPSSFETMCRTVHPDDRRRYLANVHTALERADGRYENDFRVVHPDGGIAWISSCGRVERDSDGRPVRLIGIGQDTTERKQREQSLGQAQREQQIILDNAPALIWFKDTENRILRVNATAARSLDLPKEAIEGKSTAEFYPAEADRYYRDDLIVVRTGLPRLGIEEPYRLPSGETRWIRTDKIPLKDEAGEVTRILVMAVDITDQQRAKEALRRSEEQLRAIVSQAFTGIVLTDLGGHITLVNDRFCSLTGYGREQLIGHHFGEITHPDDLPNNLEVFEQLVRTGQPTLVEKRYIRPDGSVVWVDSSVTVVCDAAGQPELILVMVQDTSERKRAEEALRDADRRKDEFLAALAHELRNPLAPIHMALELLRQPRNTGPRTEELLAMLERQVDHLTRLVDDLLELSRISHGNIELKMELVDLAAVVQQAIEISQPLVQAGGQTLNVALAPEPLILNADPVRLAQVIANLLNNAAKYTEAGGRIELTVERRDGEAAVCVRDTGIGISAEMLPRVFDLFAQADQSRDRAQGGLGIGLTLARRLVEMHGGRISAYSEGLGRGSEFIIRLPLPAACPFAAVAPIGPLPKPRVPTRLLVVDDNRDAADSLGLLLTALGSDVRVVYDGLAALEIVASFQPEVVVLDLGMPDMSGYEVARRIRQTPEGRKLTLIALTGLGQHEDRRRTREAGFDHHLVKPVKLARLQTLLASLVSGESAWAPGKAPPL